MSSAAALAAYDLQVRESTIAIWIPTAFAAVFLSIRLYVRRTRIKAWLLDDYWLALAYITLLTGTALVSVSFAADIASDDGKRHFFTYHQLSSSVLTVSTTWSKCAFAMTLWRLTSKVGARIFLAFLVISSHLLVVFSIIGIYAPACGDPKISLRPYYVWGCYSQAAVRYLFISPIVYGGIMDVLLSLFPWFIVRKLQLRRQERIGVAVAMGLGALTGMIVIMRSALQFKNLTGRFDSLAFLQIFNALEPSMTIILQTVPIFRVLFKEAKTSRSKHTPQSQIRSPISNNEFVRNYANRRTLGGDTDGYKELEMVQLTVGPGGRIVEVKNDTALQENHWKSDPREFA